MSGQAKTICVLANESSGLNSRDADAIRRAMAVFGEAAELRTWTPGNSLASVVGQARDDGFTTVVAAGGDGTVQGVATALAGTEMRLAVLPLGTFNYFARGLGLPEDPEAAARAILAGRHHTISVGSVNGQVFLNNASVGVYPQILKAREDVYARFGRRRVAAYWSVLKTFVKFQRPARLTVTADGRERRMRTPLIFIARSAYQLEQFGLKGAEAISDDRFAIYVARGTGRLALFMLAWRLVRRRIALGRDVDLITARDIIIDGPSRRLLVAFDGEKSRLRTPLAFRILDDALDLVLPAGEDA